MSRSSTIALFLIAAMLPPLGGCGEKEGQDIGRELAQARADEVRAFAVSRAADRFADQQRLRAFHVFNPQQLALDTREEP